MLLALSVLACHSHHYFKILLLECSIPLFGLVSFLLKHSETPSVKMLLEGFIVSRITGGRRRVFNIGQGWMGMFAMSNTTQKKIKTYFNVSQIRLKFHFSSLVVFFVGPVTFVLEIVISNSRHSTTCISLVSQYTSSVISLLSSNPLQFSTVTFTEKSLRLVPKWLVQKVFNSRYKPFGPFSNSKQIGLQS